jgi:hypothetical protein
LRKLIILGPVAQTILSEIAHLSFTFVQPNPLKFPLKIAEVVKIVISNALHETYLSLREVDRSLKSQIAYYKFHNFCDSIANSCRIAIH